MERDYIRLNYWTSDRSLVVDYVFWDLGERGWRIYIISHIDYQGRDCSSHAVNEIGPYTARAGFVKHLRSDFYFDMDAADIGKLVNKLHPTPAVCGIPKADTYKFICENEAYDRMYYSGFAGPLNINKEEGTHLYVTLRCMQIDGCRCRLYAGGGLLADSEVYDEWLETEAKMDTMRRCLSIKRM